MTSHAFQRVMRHIFEWEGGYSNHFADPGGATNHGITKRTLETFLGRAVSREEVQALNQDKAAQIYHKLYWTRIRGDDLPPAIGFAVMDAAVNSGVSASIKTLQTALNSQGNHLARDGAIGPNTLRAVSLADHEKLLDEFIVRRGVYYGALRTFSTFGLGWARRLMSTARRAVKLLKENTAAAQTEQLSSERQDVVRYFYNERGVQAFGTFYKHWGGWVTAGHVMDSMLGSNPPFARGEPLISPGGLDAALIGCTLPVQPPPEPNPGQKIYVAGYPAGSANLAKRRAEVYLKRPGDNSWIAMIESPAEPVVVGMSGGIVCDIETNAPMGILITRNSPANLDGDNVLDQNFDFTALSDVWQEVARLTPGV